MYSILLNAHSYLAYLLLAGLILSVLMALVGYFSNRPFTDRDRKLGLLGLIPAHLQWVLGVLLYFVSPVGMASVSGEAMKNAVTRLYVLEHPLTMVIAVVLITVGYSRAKRLTEDKARFKSIWLWYGIGLIMVLARIPWLAWPGGNQ